ncbi:MAG: hypothetical protein EXR29_14915 [Betaproteobacteria bacterium]|nr:hypothetical protein [Betaproteobacteria bacterium]
MRSAWSAIVFRLAATFLLLAGAQVSVAADNGIDIRVQIKGDEVIVDATCFVSATPREVWAVITDYDSAATYIADLKTSVVLSRANNVLVVSQKGSKGFGPFSVSVETVNEIQLTPFEKTQTRRLSGSMKKFISNTRLVAEKSGTLIVYHAESIPDVWIPPLFGEMLIENETRARFSQLRDEIMRRKELAARLSRMSPTSTQAGAHAQVAGNRADSVMRRRLRANCAGVARVAYKRNL